MRCECVRDLAGGHRLGPSFFAFDIWAVLALVGPGQNVVVVFDERFDSRVVPRFGIHCAVVGMISTVCY